MDLFVRLAEVYGEYQTRIESIDGIDYFVIINPFWDENIKISEEDGIIFFFSYQHAHFDYYGADIDKNIDCLIEYINDFLDEQLVVVEFFQEDAAVFGGSRYLNDIDVSSGESMLKSFAGDNITLYEHFREQLKGSNCRCLIRGWNNVCNKDIEFVL